MKKEISEEHLKKVRENLRKAQEAKKNKPKPSVALEEFTVRNEHFKRVYFDEEKKLGIFRRTNEHSGFLIGYELVIGKGENLAYPTDEDFGKLGWCFTGSDEHCKKQIKARTGIVLS